MYNDSRRSYRYLSLAGEGAAKRQVRNLPQRALHTIIEHLTLGLCESPHITHFSDSNQLGLASIQYNCTA